MTYDETGLARYSRSGWLGFQVVYHRQVGSTNDVALELAPTFQQEGLVVLADEQTAGRGRLNRRWSAPAGTCVLMSLVLHPRKPFQVQASRLMMACSLSLIDTIHSMTGVPARVKWPNDIIIERPHGWGKLAGMLSEVGLNEGKPAALVVGIGLNVNIPQEALGELAPNAASLMGESGQLIDRRALLDAFLTATEVRIDAVRAGYDVWSAWHKNLAWLGAHVQVTAPDRVVQGVAETVDETGALMVRLPDGTVNRFTVGDVSLRLVEP